MSDKLSELLEAGAADIAAAVQQVPSAAVRNRGQRRRRQSQLLAGAATLLVLGAGFVLPTFAPLSAPEPPSASPGTLRMPHEGEPGWQRSNDPSLATPYLDCLSADLTKAQRTAVVTMTGPGLPIEEEHSPTRLTEQLMLYDSEPSAAAAIDAIRQAMSQCGWRDPMMGGELTASRTIDDSAARYQSIDGFRQGAAVFVVYRVTGGAGMASPDNAAKDLMSQRLCEAMRSCPAMLPGGEASYVVSPTSLPHKPSSVPSYEPSLTPSSEPSILPSGPQR